MNYRLCLSLLVGLGFLLMACAADPAPTPIPPQPTNDPAFTALGGGEPRSVGYWLLWNSCAPDNRAETAALNGGREAGWIIMDDLLQDPGVLLGEQAVTTCDDGLALLQSQPIEGAKNSGDVAYPLASQLLAAQLNLAVGAEYCPAVDDAVQSAQLLLIGTGFDGRGEVLSLVPTAEEGQLAQSLTEQLREYNIGNLCR